MRITVLYYIENHRDRFVTILGAFSASDTVAVKINETIDAHLAHLESQGIRGVSRYDYHTCEQALDDTHAWL